ncbi:MAG: hypothetical protein A2402_00405 [Candidatus Staskawiczbacteria bacterium RIFOXYC1_FULL_37_43]|nr:MAG: hypothetical protein A2813_00815 [Candidatus Staskawiczbacteria bacterium RIFCSPHIGHO2_01_FULL_37_17]OGZ72324.1 MAG: hypothetical protein A2891_03585 [Candidatus Staskawiczbacteria bacterium RIFCSPLOWO2_01_FULL_37_19]OGZ76088.1 MAG: hypothetical protein A2205_03475 [Candidatus Staskawiczbacteria bacterium RIFOXYA1_FULL_37_15]OGZ77128.1 MAG: hypothetical protein A2280_03415 [Candidatus Staskawiczbacteria bacterium RIFOXYA12_FULL_37_10]OGZ80055.1 MAG: hypothetical protein A2353_02195 [Can
MFFVYILKSIKDNGYYIGQAENINKRLDMHNRGLVKSTRLRVPFVIVKTESFDTRAEARKRENYLKKLKGGNEFHRIINQ